MNRTDLLTDGLTDDLTGLPNGRTWEALLGLEEARCRHSGASASVIVVDLDGLRRVNEQHGYAGGDAYLARAADVLRSTAREADLLARLGEDEFGLLLIDEAPDTAALTDRLSAAFAAAGIPVSIGSAVRSPGAAPSLMATARRADAARSDAKAGPLRR